MKDETKNNILKVLGVVGGIAAFGIGCAVTSNLWEKHEEKKWITTHTSSRQIDFDDD